MEETRMFIRQLQENLTFLKSLKERTEADIKTTDSYTEVIDLRETLIEIDEDILDHINEIKELKETVNSKG